jgi:NTP pyrophosphatase (non-canonical NTP hydrolase)
MLQIQHDVVSNKLNHGFNTTDIPLEFCLLSGELAEAFEAWKTGDANIGEELADSAIYLFGIAELLGVDLGDEVLKKMEKNKNRKYKKTPTGHYHRISTETK